MTFGAPFSREFRPVFGPNLAAAGVTTLIHDAFTDADGTLLTAHIIAPINVPATSWTAVFGAFDIQSNQANNSANLFSNTIAVCDPGISNMRLEVDMLFPVQTSGIVLRYGSGGFSDFWWLVIGGNVIYLYENPGGVLRGSYNTGGISAGWHTLVAIANGTALSANFDGVERITYTSSVNLLNTRAGMYCYTATPNSNKFDNFKVYAL